jgi:membrane associated rhomboid family serine protease
MSAAPSAQQPWFVGAPASKLVTVGLVLVHVLLHSRKAKSTLLSETIINPHHRGDETMKWYRLITSKLVFGSNGELVLGLLAMIMLMRRFEREMGSRKFVALLFVTNMVAIVLEGSILLAFDIQNDELKYYSGPYPWLGAMLFLYAKYTPRLHPRFVSVLGISFSEKSLYYFLCAYLVFYHRDLSTFFPTVLGMMIAYIFVHSSNPVTDFPDAVAKLVPWERFFSFLLDPPVRVYAPLLQLPNNARRAGANNNAVEQLMNNLQRNRAAAVPPTMAPPAPSHPPESAIEQLTAMGFDRQSVLDALRSTNNSVERAADRLLGGAR